MLKLIAHDTINDIALIRTNFALSVRYGLEITTFDLSEIGLAVANFTHCQRHALTCEGHFG